MELFRRLLLSLFPSEVIHQQMNPGSMFVSFIAPKQFFSVVYRRIVENYKLNLFDISLDPFEVKIGFGERPTLNIKDVDIYFSYNGTANLNGWLFYAPTNLATMMTIVMSVKTKKIFVKEKLDYFRAFSMTIFLLTFVFAARIKVFPYRNKEKNYTWFIAVFFNFYETVLLQFEKTASKKTLERIKKSLLQEIHLFFTLFYFYQRINTLFSNKNLSHKEFYQRLFHDDLVKKGKAKIWLNDFINHAHGYNKLTTFSPQDLDVMKLIFPVDILARYLFVNKYSDTIVNKLLSSLFEKEKLDKYLHSFLKSDAQFDDFLSYIMDWTLFKKNYFKGIKKLRMHVFGIKGKYNYAVEKEIDSFMSSLDDGEALGNVPIPKKLREESTLMDNLINFYVTHLGGLRIARGDNFHIRLFKRDLLDKLVIFPDEKKMNQDGLYFYGSLLYNYSKNLFYYQYTYDNIKDGKDSFTLPLKPTSKEIQSNMFVLKLFHENFMSTLLQDINKKFIKIYIQNKKILKLFKNAFGDHISKTIGVKKSIFLQKVYGDVHFFLQDMPQFFPALEKALTGDEIKIMKENLYSMDIQLWQKALRILVQHEVSFSTMYQDLTIIGIFSTMRETLFGFLLWYTYMDNAGADADVNLHQELIKRIYICDVLNLGSDYSEIFSHMLNILLNQYKELLNKWIKLDGNRKYFAIGLGNWLSFIDGKEVQKIMDDVMGEDIIRFRGYIKTITYYNKRYMIPK